MKLTIVTGDWDSLRDHAQSLRVEVFVVEQGVPIELEWDEADEVSTHAVAYDEAGQVIATGRLLPDGHIGRMVVRKSARGNGIGSEVLAALLAEAKRRQFTNWCYTPRHMRLIFISSTGFRLKATNFWRRASHTGA